MDLVTVTFVKLENFSDLRRTHPMLVTATNLGRTVAPLFQEIAYRVGSPVGVGVDDLLTLAVSVVAIVAVAGKDIRTLAKEDFTRLLAIVNLKVIVPVGFLLLVFPALVGVSCFGVVRSLLKKDKPFGVDDAEVVGTEVNEVVD